SFDHRRLSAWLPSDRPPYRVYSDAEAQSGKAARNTLVSGGSAPQAEMDVAAPGLPGRQHDQPGVYALRLQIDGIGRAGVGFERDDPAIERRVQHPFAELSVGGDIHLQPARRIAQPAL